MKKRNTLICFLLLCYLSANAGLNVDYTKGIFFLNEDWFGHTNSSLNFMTAEGEFLYRVYTEANPGEAFGCTAQFAAIYGDKLYVISKQKAEAGDTDYIPGGRIVVADAITLKKIKGIDNIGGSDGRSFLGVDKKTAYIGTSNGIFLFDLEELAVGDLIEGTDGASGLYSSQTGMMVRAGRYVFAAKQGEGVLVIDATTHRIHTVIAEADIVTLTRSKDGRVWAARNDAFVKINPYTLETETIAFPEGVTIVASWPAWNAGSLCAGVRENVLYFTNQGNFGFNGETVRKYYIDSGEFDPSFFILPDQTDEEGKILRYRQTFYGAGVRVDPASENLIITTTETGGSSHYQKNWVHIVSGNSGELIDTKELDAYYWFPAMPFFPNNTLPETIDLTEWNPEEGESYSLWLGGVVVNKENPDLGTVESVLSNSDESLVSAILEDDMLLLTPLSGEAGTATIILQFNSNGQLIPHAIEVKIGMVSGLKGGLQSGSYYRMSGKTLFVYAGSGEKVILSDLQGRILYSMVATEKELVIPSNTLPEGIYLLHIGGINHKIIIK
ncbi:MAG: DUF5074 domain-containing protein [Candidatus Azobacteroides sp.]|nr:DUF5074 domain-containing protein [Candidatus Azobacteroides sp.]